MADQRAGDPDPIERYGSRGLRPTSGVFGREQFQAWARRECNANTDGYAAPRANSPDPLQEAWRNEPWITPVVGSGPIGFPQDFAAKAAWLPLLVVREMEGNGSGLESDLEARVTAGADPAVFVKDFVDGLIARRYGMPVDGPDGSEPPDLTIDRSVVWVVVAAAQLTRTFHRMSLDASRPISRWGSEKAEVSYDHPRAGDLAEEYLPLLEHACRKAGAALKQRAHQIEQHADDRLADDADSAAVALRAIASLVSAIAERVRAENPQIMLAHLEQLTDASWYLLAQAVLNDIDPGWTSLMLQLVLTQPDEGATGLFRPRWNELEAVANGVRDVYTRATSSASARRRGPERRTPVTGFYDSVADVLWAQSEAVHWATTRQRANGEIGWRLPRPVSWVCSFDYEVELALWRAAAKRGLSTQFAVVMPVYVRQSGRPTHGDLVWLEATIDVPRGAGELSDEETFRSVTTVSSWRLLTSTTDEGISGDATNHRPVVVHLLGCPLITLPDIVPPRPRSAGTPGQNRVRAELVSSKTLMDSASDESAGRPQPELRRRSALVHAVTVDEVLAVRQTARDWRQITDTTDSTSLPLDLFRASGPASRMYAVLGVPLRDPAVRLRVTAVLSWGAQLSDRGDDAGLGLFVNKRIDDEELTVMGALGLDVFKTRCEDFRESLSGYAGSLREHCAQIDRWSAPASTDEGAEAPNRSAALSRPGDRPAPAANEAEPRRTKESWKSKTKS